MDDLTRQLAAAPDILGRLDVPEDVRVDVETLKLACLVAAKTIDGCRCGDMLQMRPDRVERDQIRRWQLQVEALQKALDDDAARSMVPGTSSGSVEGPDGGEESSFVSSGKVRRRFLRRTRG